MKPRLVSLKVSPWSERVKWALDHHRIEYDRVEHVPFLGERRLQRLVGKSKARATVPVLVVDGEVLSESWDIARYADRVGRGVKLIPAEREAEIRSWTELADRTMEVGRALVSQALLGSPQALEETLPRHVPRWLARWLRPVARHGATWFARKYQVNLEDEAGPLGELRSTFEKLRAALAPGRPYLLGAFSYADIAMALILQGVMPVSDRFLRLGPATRKVWTRPELAGDFADLVAWRDELYERHRRPR